MLSVLTGRLAAAGVKRDADLALVRSVMSGLAGEQVANDPAGRTFADQTERAVRYVLAALRQDAGRQVTRSKRKPANRV